MHNSPRPSKRRPPALQSTKQAGAARTPRGARKIYELCHKGFTHMWMRVIEFYCNKSRTSFALSAETDSPHHDFGFVAVLLSPTSLPTLSPSTQTNKQTHRQTTHPNKQRVTETVWEEWQFQQTCTIIYISVCAAEFFIRSHCWRLSVCCVCCSFWFYWWNVELAHRWQKVELPLTGGECMLYVFL